MSESLPDPSDPLYRFVDHWTLYVCPGCGAWSDAEGYCCIPENHADYVQRVPVKVAPLDDQRVAEAYDRGFDDGVARDAEIPTP